MRDFAIGVDVGGTNLRVAAVTSKGELFEKISLTTQVSAGAPRTAGRGLRAPSFIPAPAA